jgi:hypothetical protein
MARLNPQGSADERESEACERSTRRRMSNGCGRCQNLILGKVVTVVVVAGQKVGMIEILVPRCCLGRDIEAKHSHKKISKGRKVNNILIEEK